MANKLNTNRNRSTYELRNLLEVRVRKLNERSYTEEDILKALHEIRALVDHKLSRWGA